MRVALYRPLPGGDRAKLVGLKGERQKTGADDSAPELALSTLSCLSAFGAL